MLEAHETTLKMYFTTVWTTDNRKNSLFFAISISWRSYFWVKYRYIESHCSKVSTNELLFLQTSQ